MLSAFKYRTFQRKVVVVLVGFATCIHINKSNLALIVGGHFGVNVAIFNSYVAALVTNVNNRRIFHAFIYGNFNATKCGVGCTIESKHAMFFCHLIFRIATCIKLIVVYLNIRRLACRRGDEQCVVCRHTSYCRDKHILLVVAWLNADGYRTIDTIFQSIDSLLNCLVFLI